MGWVAWFIPHRYREAAPVDAGATHRHLIAHSLARDQGPRVEQRGCKVALRIGGQDLKAVHLVVEIWMEAGAEV